MLDYALFEGYTVIRQQTLWYSIDRGLTRQNLKHSATVHLERQVVGGQQKNPKCSAAISFSEMVSGWQATEKLAIEREDTSLRRVTPFLNISTERRRTNWSVINHLKNIYPSFSPPLKNTPPIF